jgi:hypothetical protein
VQVLDRFALSVADPATDQQNEKLKRHHGRHGHGTVSAGKPLLRNAISATIPGDRLSEHDGRNARGDD